MCRCITKVPRGLFSRLPFFPCASSHSSRTRVFSGDEWWSYFLGRFTREFHSLFSCKTRMRHVVFSIPTTDAMAETTTTAVITVANSGSWTRARTNGGREED